MNALITSFRFKAPNLFFAFHAFHAVAFALYTRSAYTTRCLSIADRNAHLFMSFNCAHCRIVAHQHTVRRVVIHVGRMNPSIEHEKPQSNISICMSHCLCLHFYVLFSILGKGLKEKIAGNSLTFPTCLYGFQSSYTVCRLVSH